MSKANTTNQASKQPNTIILDDKAYKKLVKEKCKVQLKGGVTSYKKLANEAILAYFK